jgi:hypothetical protein
MNRKIFAMAEWLLERFGIPQRNESLMRDLMEETARADPLSGFCVRS